MRHRSQQTANKQHNNKVGCKTNTKEEGSPIQIPETRSLNIHEDREKLTFEHSDASTQEIKSGMNRQGTKLIFRELNTNNKLKAGTS